jgi:hypothetical protein
MLNTMNNPAKIRFIGIECLFFTDTSGVNFVQANLLVSVYAGPGKFPDSFRGIFLWSISCQTSNVNLNYNCARRNHVSSSWNAGDNWLTRRTLS